MNTLIRFFLSFAIITMAGAAYAISSCPPSSTVMTVSTHLNNCHISATDLIISKKVVIKGGSIHATSVHIEADARLEGVSIQATDLNIGTGVQFQNATIHATGAEVATGVGFTGGSFNGTVTSVQTAIFKDVTMSWTNFCIEGNVVFEGATKILNGLEQATNRCPGKLFVLTKVPNEYRYP